MGLAQTLPVVLLQGQTFWRAPGKVLWKQREQQGWRCCCSPFPVMFPRSSRACLALLCPPPPAPKDSVHLLWIRLEVAPGWGSDETCLGKTLPGEGWGYPAPAAFWNSSSPGCWPPPSQFPALREQEHCSPCSPRGGFLLHCTLCSMSKPPQFHLAQHSTLLQLLHGFLHEAHLSFPLSRDRITELLPDWKSSDCSSLLARESRLCLPNMCQ